MSGDGRTRGSPTIDDRENSPARELLDAASPGSGPPLVVVTGPTGSGRTAALAELRATLLARGVTVTSMRFSPGGGAAPAVPSATSGRGTLAARYGAAHPSAWLPFGPVEGAHADPAAAGWAGAAAAAPLLAGGNTVVLVDDAQWMDRDSLAVLEALVRRLRAGTVRVVCAVRTPATDLVAAGAAAMMRRLRRDDLVVSIRLPLFDEARIVRELRTAVAAVPSAELVDRVRGLTRGIPAAVADLVAGLRADGAVHVVDRHAHLVPPVRRTGMEGHHLLRGVRGLAPGLADAATAAAVLHPVGPALPDLLATALGVPADEATDRLAALRDAGVLHHGGGSWRFVVPLLAEALVSGIGPYERRRLAMIVVEAVRDGTATGVDDAYLTDRVADAGRLAPARWALDLLCAQARAAVPGDPERASRWLSAAVELASDRTERVEILRMHLRTSFDGGDYPTAVALAREILHYDAERLPVPARQIVAILLVFSLHNVGDVESLEEIAAGTRETLGDEPLRRIGQAIALVHLDRWVESRELLDSTEDVWSRSPATRAPGRMFGAFTALYTGEPGPFEEMLAAAEQGRHVASGWERESHIEGLVSALLTVGELRRAERLLDAEGQAPETLAPAGQVLVSLMRGRTGASLDDARRTVARSAGRGSGTVHAPMSQIMAFLLIAQGRLSGARDLLASARAGAPTLEHLLEDPEAEIDVILGDVARAEARLTDALDTGKRRGLLVGSDVTLAQLAGFALDRGDLDVAQRRAVELEDVADRMGTSRSAMYATITRAAVDRDPALAREGLRIGRERGIPFELATTQLRLVAHGVADPALLSEAYATFGDLDALLFRAWTRTLMTATEVPIPGRRVTVEENERLL
ncbi:MAG: ATP-binding protein, partial [Pseudonocardia sediminis]